MAHRRNPIQKNNRRKRRGLKPKTRVGIPLWKRPAIVGLGWFK